MESLYTEINDPEEIKLVPVTFLLPKDLVKAFDASGFTNENKKRHSISKRLARYLLCYHKIMTRKDITTLKVFLDLPEIEQKLLAHDAKCQYT